MITTTRFKKNTDYLIQSGADHVIIPSENDLASSINKITNGHGIDAAFDPVGQGMISKYSPALARDATIYFYGTLDGVFPQLPIVDMFQANATFHPYSLFNYVENADMKKRGTDFVYKSLKEKKLKPNIDRVYPMEEYRNAWNYLKEPRNKHGKVVIETGL